MIYDLHIHTSASDGIFSPSEVICQAYEIGLAGLAITDHDTVDGLGEARSFIQKEGLNLEFIPGIEMNTELNGREIHILGYFIDYSNSSLLYRLREIKKARFTRAHKMVGRLSDMGIKVELKQVEEIAQGDIIARPHIAQALVDNNYAATVEEAFDKYIGKGRPAYVNRYKFLPAEAIELVKTAGGISVLAHPGLIGDDNMIDNIVRLGIEGIEVFYPEHDTGQIAEYSRICREKKLLLTGGSDFHGYDRDSSRGKLGSCGINAELMRDIYNYQENKNK